MDKKILRTLVVTIGMSTGCGWIGDAAAIELCVCAQNSASGGQWFYDICYYSTSLDGWRRAYTPAPNQKTCQSWTNASREKGHCVMHHSCETYD